ncbi:MAG: hypothetical protein JJD93_15720 [Ilumatobacteraceae bacterium]|nr:hypothetical protein [Ilumatobacteraceae bacterium]
MPAVSRQAVRGLGVDDPDGMDLDAIRPIRDEIRRRVQDLLASLSIEPS